MDSDNWKYLLKSDIVAEEMVISEVGANWNLLLSLPEVNAYYKAFIRHFLKPFKISGLKYSFNYEYIQLQDYYLDNDNNEFWGRNYDHVSPSMRLLLKDYLDIPQGYPLWFIASFPDVILWAMKGEGLGFVKEDYADMDESYLSADGRHLSDIMLLKIIDIYIKRTANKLECIWYTAS